MNDDFDVIQSEGNGVWFTTITRNGHRVTQFYTLTAWGGRRLAKRTIKRRIKYGLPQYR